ncbi:hypothetical protein FOJ82_00195 [Tessaracoccus rhinocerotis]|uniref:Zinc ribbon domain-containing protein n=1 Tax=Tessaracoccus rhinocerotis TaxID=1689449 RepID=A0A553K3V8_9ACTN|nr:DUF6320 domain-containing protein [Tessaracoccus rhinocerotis]TRY19375.1 hypothetical protein FOJ82_00195 [Tessaracoccus rhinocerotis]
MTATKHCPGCGSTVLGRWRSCPLCHGPLEGVLQAADEPETYPAPPLRFDRRQLRKVLLVFSALAVAASFAAQVLVPDLMAPVRTVWLSIATLWLVVLAVARRRRHFTGLVLWLVVLLSGAAVAWELVTDGPPWAVTWALPAICTSANLALGLAGWVVRLDPLEHISKGLLVVLLGLVPGIFVLTGWVSVITPSLVCVGISVVMLAAILVLRHRVLWQALQRRLHV